MTLFAAELEEPKIGIPGKGLGRKHSGKKEKLFVTSNFSSFHNVSKSSLLLMRQNEYLWI